MAELVRQIYDKIRKDKTEKAGGAGVYVSPVEVLIVKIESDICSKSFTAIGLTSGDIKELRELPYSGIANLSHLKDRDKGVECNTKKNETWIRSYIWRTRPDIYEKVVIYSRNGIIFIVTKDLNLY